MTADIRFSRGPARRPSVVVADPLLQWSTGLSTNDRRIYTGWLVEAGRHDTLDEAMHAAGFERITIKHGSGNLVNHWAITTANAFILADGVQSIAEMRQTSERYGIAFAWRTLEDGRRQSVLKCRVLLRELLAVGFTTPLMLSLKGTLTGDIIDAFTRQYEVLDAIDALRTQQGKEPLHPPFYACSIPLTFGPEVLRGATAQKSMVVPVASIPAPISRSYLVEHYIRKEWLALVEGLIEPSIAWSLSTSARIMVGDSHDAEDEV